MTRKTEPHSKCSSRAPESSGPSAAIAPPIADQSAIDRVRAAPAQSAVISASVVGIGHPGGDAAEQAGGEEDAVGGRQPGQQRGRDREPHAEQQHRLAPVAVAERAQVEDRGGEPERVADRDQVERRLAGAEGLADVRQGDVGDGEVEVGDGGDQDQRREDEAGALGASRLHLRRNLPQLDRAHAAAPPALKGLAPMADDRKRPEQPRAEKVLPGIWRLRLPLFWPGVPHGNVWAVAADGGIVLFDTGIGDKGGLRRLDIALAQAGFGLEDVRLLVCTHSHTDHYGLAAPIVEGAGCELWMHPAWGHVRLMADDPKAALEQRIEAARQSGVPMASLERYRESREEDDDNGIAAIVEPDRELLPGVEVETDLGAWQVHETPGHAPSHVVLHQPERRLMISGDHLLGRTVLFFDHGHSPDPVGEFLGGLDEVEPLAVDLVLPGHGRTFRDPEAKIAEARRQVDELLGKVREALAEGERTAFEIVGEIIGAENLNTPVSAWVLQIVLSCLDHLVVLGEVEPVEGSDPKRWKLG